MKAKNIFRRVSNILVISVILTSVLHAKTVPARSAPQTKEASVAKVTQLLRGSGYAHRQTSETTWIIERPGKSSILVAAGTDFLVLGIIVAVKKNIRVSADLNFKLLKLNHSLDYVKTGFDDDDDLFVRNELRIRTMDLASFRAMIDDVVAGAEKAQQLVNPFLISP